MKFMIIGWILGSIVAVIVSKSLEFDRSSSFVLGCVSAGLGIAGGLFLSDWLER